MKNSEILEKLAFGLVELEVVSMSIKPNTKRHNQQRMCKRLRTEKPNKLGQVRPVKAKGTLKEKSEPKIIYSKEKTTFTSAAYGSPILTATFNIEDIAPSELQKMYENINATYFMYETMKESQWLKLKEHLVKAAQQLHIPKEKQLFWVNRTKEGVNLFIKRTAPNEFLNQVTTLAA